jgi:biotin operon repressor
MVYLLFFSGDRNRDRDNNEETAVVPVLTPAREQSPEQQEQSQDTGEVVGLWKVDKFIAEFDGNTVTYDFERGVHIEYIDGLSETSELYTDLLFLEINKDNIAMFIVHNTEEGWAECFLFEWENEFKFLAFPQHPIIVESISVSGSVLTIIGEPANEEGVLVTMTLNRAEDNSMPIASETKATLEFSVTDEVLAKICSSGIISQHIKHLEISWGNQISDITPLQSLTHLESLTIWSNIEDITPLQLLTQLKYLSISGNQISDITPLQTLTQLTHLYLNGNNISDITPLQSLTLLTNLTLSYNEISDITVLASLNQLEWLLIMHNSIEDITPLKNLTNLRVLNAQENQITDVSPLHLLTNLYFLNLRNNQINDATPLFSLHQLETLNLSGNMVSEEQIDELQRAIPNCDITW